MATSMVRQRLIRSHFVGDHVKLILNRDYIVVALSYAAGNIKRKFSNQCFKKLNFNFEKINIVLTQ